MTTQTPLPPPPAHRGPHGTLADAAAERIAPFRDRFPYTSRFIDVPLRDGSNAALHYVDEGPRAASGTILCVHGNPTWSFYWRAVIEGCKDTTRVVAPDHLGMGFSQRVAGGVRLADHIDALAALIDALDLNDVTLAVHDWGGAIGFGAALKRPDRIAGFVVTNTAAFASGFMPKRIAACRVPGLGRLAVQGANAFARAATRQTTVTPLDPSVRHALLAPYANWTEREQIWRFVADIPMQTSHPSWDTLCEIGDGIPRFRGLPMEIVWGMHDWCFTPTFLASWRERYPDAPVTELHGAGHYVNEDAPEAIVAAVRRVHRASTGGAA